MAGAPTEESQDEAQAAGEGQGEVQARSQPKESAFNGRLLVSGCYPGLAEFRVRSSTVSAHCTRDMAVANQEINPEALLAQVGLRLPDMPSSEDEQRIKAQWARVPLKPAAELAALSPEEHEATHVDQLNNLIRSMGDVLSLPKATASKVIGLKNSRLHFGDQDEVVPKDFRPDAAFATTSLPQTASGDWWVPQDCDCGGGEKSARQ